MDFVETIHNHYFYFSGFFGVSEEMPGMSGLEFMAQ